MPVRLGQGVAVAGTACAAEAVGRDDLLEQVRLVASKPGAQGGSEVEAQARVIVDDGGNAVALPEQARRGVGPVALGREPGVPVVVGGRRVLHLDFIEPRVLARRLVKVAVDTDVPHGQETYRFPGPGCRGDLSSHRATNRAALGCRIKLAKQMLFKQDWCISPADCCGHHAITMHAMRRDNMSSRMGQWVLVEAFLAALSLPFAGSSAEAPNPAEDEVRQASDAFYAALNRMFTG